MAARHVMASTLLRNTSFGTYVVIKHEYTGTEYYSGMVSAIFNDDFWESKYSELRVENVSISNDRMIIGVIRP